MIVECPVCMNPTERVLPCGHRLCDPCEQAWRARSPTCPTCRASLAEPVEDFRTFLRAMEEVEARWSEPRGPPARGRPLPSPRAAVRRRPDRRPAPLSYVASRRPGGSPARPRALESRVEADVAVLSRFSTSAEWSAHATRQAARGGDRDWRCACADLCEACHRAYRRLLDRLRH